MPGFARLRMNLRSAIALGIGLAGAGLVAAPAVAVIPSPPPGRRRWSRLPRALSASTPQLPAGVIAASAARGSRWKPEKAIYGTASINDIAVKGAGGTTIRVNEIYPTTASGKPAKGPFPVLLTMTPYGKGQGGSSTPGLGVLVVGRRGDRRRRQLPGPARLHRGRRGRPRHRRLERQLGTVRPDPAAGRDPGPELGCAPAALRRAGRHLRTVVPGHRPDAAGGRRRPAFAAEGHLPDGQRPTTSTATPRSWAG